MQPHRTRPISGQLLAVVGCSICLARSFRSPDAGLAPDFRGVRSRAARPPAFGISVCEDSLIVVASQIGRVIITTDGVMCLQSNGDTAYAGVRSTVAYYMISLVAAGAGGAAGRGPFKPPVCGRPPNQYQTRPPPSPRTLQQTAVRSIFGRRPSLKYTYDVDAMLLSRSPSPYITAY
ncbi:hypothetical protein EVAR_78290_1 [Eumeta japonica]|uniref:Uncharacterized protein n=1 Tax=Eumeta variegata TaxID=151549 RepID=A0A4C1T3A2_EUMVA|nr:hypothetical protein EVAR_78290_1 [Eumeta japonica]